ncbi:conserved exported protein of unknown function [Hyphomicrobium sp. 1Nfss2.1]|uniref:hypothetical protein n=1 Tax=Hyphomicrobium sp. 1Nfss2.1 TaxID=3413936 RepID=UPI003C7B98CD
MLKTIVGGSKFSVWSMLGAATLVAAGSFLAMAPAAESKPAKGSGSLAGSWSGSGWVSFSNGKRERARCRAHYSPNGGKSFSLSATCATASGKASQSATVYEVSRNRFRGTFHNTEYNVTGSIRVVLSGNSQSVTLSGDSNSAALSLSRR